VPDSPTSNGDVCPGSQCPRGNLSGRDLSGGHLSYLLVSCCLTVYC